MGAENLDQTDLERRDLAVHENTRQIQLYLETDVDTGAIDRRTPPKRETTVRNLVQTVSGRQPADEGEGQVTTTTPKEG